MKFGRSKSSTSKLEEEIDLRKQEVEMLMKENAQLRDTINNMTFTDDDGLFVIRKNSDNFYGRVMVTAACALLRNSQDPKTMINFAYEVVNQ